MRVTRTSSSDLFLQQTGDRAEPLAWRRRVEKTGLVTSARDRILARRAQFLAGAGALIACSSSTAPPPDPRPQVCLGATCDESPVYLDVDLPKATLCVGEAVTAVTKLENGCGRPAAAAVNWSIEPEGVVTVEVTEGRAVLTGAQEGTARLRVSTTGDRSERYLDLTVTTCEDGGADGATDTAELDAAPEADADD